MARTKLATWPAHTVPRSWQLKALRRLAASTERDFLIVATPGAGKTIMALLVAHQMVQEGHVERVVIVCPTDHLRRQWATAANRVGIHLDPLWSNADGVEATDYHGISVTYQQVSFAPSLFAKQCERPTLVILDELHHAGDQLPWGDSLREAFGPAIFRVSLSGTPFRSDSNQIPFITYTEGRSVADFTYGYGDALADGVCRPIYFPCFEGRVEWLSRDGAHEDCSLLDPISREKAAERLRTALDPSGEWLHTILREAHAKVLEARSRGHHDAAGIVIAIDQEHAKRIAKLLREITGTDPVLPISDDPDASDKIKRFKGSTDAWMVAVRMVSEGVDIPRLRVGVYATNILSELFFRQVIGRLVRMVVGLKEQSASLFIPAVEPLLRHALTIKEEREHYLAQRIEAESPERAEGKTALDAKDGQGDYVFMPISSEPAPHDTIYDGASFNPAELAIAERIGQELGIALPPAQVAAILRRGAAEAGVHVLCRAPESAPSAIPVFGTHEARVPPAMFERKQAWRRETQRLTVKLAYMLGVEPREIHTQWQQLGGMSQTNATEDDLRLKHDWLQRRMKEVMRNAG